MQRARDQGDPGFMNCWPGFDWKGFESGPEWVKIRDDSEARGQLVEKIDSTFMVPTDFSPVV